MPRASTARAHGAPAWPPWSRLTRVAAVGLTLALFATACGSDDDGTAGDEATRTVTLMTHDSFNVSENVLDAFTAETGIEVRLLPSGDAGAALNQAILTKDDPVADVLFGTDNTFLGRALEEGLFVPHDTEGIDAVAGEFRLDPQGRVTPIDYGDVCVNSDLAWFEERAIPVPETLDDLADPAYRGLLAVQSPATSSPGLAFLLATVALYGEDGFEEYWGRLRDNDVLVTSGWEDAYYGQFSAASDGDHPLVVSYASSPAAEVVFAEEPLAEAPTGVLSDTCFRQVEFAGILANAANPDEARELVDFLLSKDFQEDVPLQMFVYPVAPDAALPDVFVEHSAPVEDPFTVDPTVIDDNREDWIARWDDVVLG